MEDLEFSPENLVLSTDEKVVYFIRENEKDGKVWVSKTRLIQECLHGKLEAQKQWRKTLYNRLDHLVLTGRIVQMRNSFLLSQEERKGIPCRPIV